MIDISANRPISFLIAVCQRALVGDSGIIVVTRLTTRRFAGGQCYYYY